MTNREYFNQKKEVFYNKVGDFFEKYLNLIYLFCLVLDILLLVTVLKIGSLFLLFFIPWTFFCIGLTGLMIELWLDKEYKERE